MTVWLDSTNPHVVEGVLLVGDQNATIAEGIHPILIQLGIIPAVYYRGAPGWTRLTSCPEERHPDYDVGIPGVHPNRNRALVECDESIAALCNGLQIQVTVAAVTLTVTLPAITLPSKPADWPVPEGL